MRERFSIIVDVDTEAPGVSKVIFPYMPTVYDVYTVEIRGDVHKFGIDVLATVAHEIGHALARAFDLPRAALDPRSHRSPFSDHPDEQLRAEAKVPAEEEAWEIAAAIVPVHPNDVKAIATYRGVAARLLTRPSKTGSGWVRLP